ncbi:MAG TPA: glycosyltransferase family 39 protein [Bacteroidia bacterium]|nr:glycosyltransferase family 39 protein [Bacteroidia bacterium]
MNFFRKKLPVITVSLLSLALVIFKWKDLSLPAYWDEGFPYVYAIRYLADHHLTLLPSGMPPLYSTGHPTLFYFLAAAWMKISGTGIATAHIFPLAISVVLLFAVYRFGKIFFSEWAGVFAVLLLATRAVFLAQSSMLLPENLVALFMLLAFEAWLKKRNWLYFTWASLLLLTKEPGLVFIGVIGLYDFFTLLRTREIPFGKKIRILAVIASPVLPAVLFFIVQRIQLGWFFFPRHIHSFETTPGEYYDKLVKGFGSQFFVYYGGLFITIAIASLLAYGRKQLKYITAVQRTFLRTVPLIVVAYILFFSFSFPIPRYILCLYPLWFLMAGFLATQLLQPVKKFAAPALLFLLAAIQAGYAYDIRSQADFDLGYADGVRVEQQAIDWCVKNNYMNSPVFAQEILQRGMTSDADGFVSPENIFHNVGHSFNDSTRLFIFTSFLPEPNETEARKLPLELLQRFTSGKAWIEIWTWKTGDSL